MSIFLLHHFSSVTWTLAAPTNSTTSDITGANIPLLTTNLCSSNLVFQLIPLPVHQSQLVLQPSGTSTFSLPKSPRSVFASLPVQFKCSGFSPHHLSVNFLAALSFCRTTWKPDIVTQLLGWIRLPCFFFPYTCTWTANIYLKASLPGTVPSIFCLQKLILYMRLVLLVIFYR